MFGEPRSSESQTPPDRVGNYRVVAKIGEGGMGEVFLAEHVELGKRAALKVLAPHLCRDPEQVARFRREAMAAVRIEHPAIVEVFDFGALPDGRVYILMEYLEGQSLADLLAERARLPLAQATRLLLELCDGLAAAHRAGIVHRDLKPANIFLAREGHRTQVKLLDFGIAKLLDPPKGADDSSTRTGMILGTPAYMAPEQAAGRHRDIGPATDVYALGVLAFQLLTGRPPFAAPTPIELLAKHLRAPPPHLDTGDPALDAALDPVIQKALAKDPAERYESAEEFAAAFRKAAPDRDSGLLETVAAPSPSGAVRPAATHAGPRARFRLGLGIFLVALTGAIGAGLATWLFQRPRENPSRPAAARSRQPARLQPRPPAPRLAHYAATERSRLASPVGAAPTGRKGSNAPGSSVPSRRNLAREADRPGKNTRKPQRPRSRPAHPRSALARALQSAEARARPRRPRTRPQGAQSPRPGRPGPRSTRGNARKIRPARPSRLGLFRGKYALRRRADALRRQGRWAEAAAAYYELSTRYWETGAIKPALYAACRSGRKSLIHKTWRRAKKFFPLQELVRAAKPCRARGMKLK